MGPDLNEDEEDPDSNEDARMSFETCKVLLRVFLIRFPVFITMRNIISSLINQKEESLIMSTSVLTPAATSKAMKKVIKHFQKKGLR